MGSLKRKLAENPPGETPQKQVHGDNNGLMARVDDEPVTCLHDVSYPEGYVPPPPSAREGLGPAKVFPFTLDPFQSEAINCLEKGESVMVSFLFHCYYYHRSVILIVFHKIFT